MRVCTLFSLSIHPLVNQASINMDGCTSISVVCQTSLGMYIPRYIIAELCGISTFGFWRESSFDSLNGYKIQRPPPSPAQVVS